MITLIIACAPGVSLLLWLAFECPEVWKRRILSIPSWITSNLIGFAIMGISRGVMGITTGFVTDIILTVGLWTMHRYMLWSDAREARKVFKQREKNRQFKGALA